MMFPSVSNYAPGRMELHLRRFVQLRGYQNGGKTLVRRLGEHYLSRFHDLDRVEKLGERLLPNFHQGLVLFYPAGSFIRPHRDSPAYRSGAASVNVSGIAKFLISETQDTGRMETYTLRPGDCIRFDNKQPHGVEKLEGDRWCICFFYLKPEFLEEQFKQLSLLS